MVKDKFEPGTVLYRHIFGVIVSAHVSIQYFLLVPIYLFHVLVEFVSCDHFSWSVSAPTGMEIPM